MRLLAIETSCDETGIAILEARTIRGKLSTVTVPANLILSQAKLHAEYGGVFPALARREHAKTIVPLIVQTLKDAGLEHKRKIPRTLTAKESRTLEKTLHKEPSLLAEITHVFTTLKTPKIDAIAVTSGPGLEPALWVGINTAEALGVLWSVPVIPVNHMEGHIVASLLSQKSKVESGKWKDYRLTTINYPALALLISGGHTELVLMPRAGAYKLLGQTRDDAVGEAFDKVARMLGLSYPGGPEISRIAETAPAHDTPPYPLPRPMLHSGDFDFSFAGLKTAVLYTIKKIPLSPAIAGSGEHPSQADILANLTPEIKASIAKEFEDAATEVLLAKTLAAAKKYKVKEIILGGGVTANKKIRAAFRETITEKMPDVTLFIPDRELSTDNGLMIGIAGLLRHDIALAKSGFATQKSKKHVVADGKLRLSKSATR